MLFGEGHVFFDGIKCVYIINKEGIKLIPVNEEDTRILNRHFDDQHFLFRYSDIIDKNCTAYIDRVEMNAGHSLKLIPKYCLRLYNNNPITSMQITGPSIDELFHPAGYYYSKAKSGETNNVDLTREVETADKWTIIVDGITIDIRLQYGGILRRGIGSDMMLHPELIASFDPTTDSAFLFKIYSVITRFLQIAQYNSNTGECKVYLCGDSAVHNSGYLNDWTMIGVKRSFYNEVEYRFLKPYIQYLLQFSADNTNIALDFLPDADYRWNRTDYSPQSLVALFAAFESEYKANITAYETEPPEDLSRIKNSVVQKIHECSNDLLSDYEKSFLLQAENNIQNIGNQVGQTRKIKNVIHTFSPTLKSSAEYLFTRKHIGSKEGFNDKEIEMIAKELVGLRATVSHEYSLLAFDDFQTEYVHFLEILVHAQMLKRAGIDDVGIELLIGLIFHCNYVHMNLERYLNQRQK